MAKNKTINKSEVFSINDMALYLTDYAKKQSCLYHYTTYESLLYIIKNKSIRFSRTRLLNDKKEQEFCGKNDCFILSLTGEKEYISMWSLYGRPSGIKIRIDFPRTAFQNDFKKENVFLESELKTEYFPYKNYLFEVPTDQIKKECVLSSVTYIDSDKTAFEHNGNKFDRVEVSDNNLEHMAGFIKYEAWSFEKEIRARILSKDYRQIINSDGSRYAPFDLNEKPDYLYLKISNELIKNIRVTFNPWMQDVMKEEITDSLSHYGIVCRNSDYDGQIDEL